MDIKADINWIHQEIDKVQAPTFIEKLKHLLQSKNTISKDENKAYNIDLEKALEDIQNGNFFTEEEAKTIASKWGRK